MDALSLHNIICSKQRNRHWQGSYKTIHEWQDTMPNLIQRQNIDLVKKALKRYNSAIESLDVTR